MTASICNHELKNEYEHAMLQCVRCELQNELKECKTCKTNKNKLKKANNIFPDAIVDLINSFNACKRCIKTIDIIKNEPNEMNIEEANLWYFVKLNPMPSKTILNKQLQGHHGLVRPVGSLALSDCRVDIYKNWFNELWKPRNTSKKRQYNIMMDILMIMFSINGRRHKLEYSNIFNEKFFRDNVYSYLTKNTTMYGRNIIEFSDGYD